jgi:phosphoribosyl-AMP cyclohydrolase
MYAVHPRASPAAGTRYYVRGMTSGSSMQFPTAASKLELEEGTIFTPRFDPTGLIVCVTTDTHTGAVLMVAYMNEEALRLTIESGVAHYWSRSRQALWRKGDTSGQVQTVTEVRTDCDQDAILLKVIVGGDGNSCHTGRKSCFYRRVNAAGVEQLVFDAY